MNALLDDKRLVTVCAACLCAGCAQNHFSCTRHKAAGTTEKTVVELRTLDRESSEWWEADEA